MSTYYRAKKEKQEKIKPKYFKNKNGKDQKWTQNWIGETKKTGSNFINIVQAFRTGPFQEGHADYWIVDEIKKLFKEKEYNLNLHGKNFITLFLWGRSFLDSEINRSDALEQNSYKICWVYSHPTTFTKKEAKYYDKIFFASEDSAIIFSRLLQQPNISKIPIYSFSSFEEPKQKTKELKFDIVFVANARGNKKQYGRNIVRDLDPELDVSLWGRNWERRSINQKWYKGRFFPFWDLPNLYKSAKICLNDHHDEHNTWDYVSFRIFDIVKSGGFCISDYNSGIEKIFGNTVVTFKTKEELNSKIKYFLVHPKERKDHIKAAQEKIKNFTAKKEIEKMLRESNVL